MVFLWSKLPTKKVNETIFLFYTSISLLHAFGILRYLAGILSTNTKCIKYALRKPIKYTLFLLNLKQKLIEICVSWFCCCWEWLCVIQLAAWPEKRLRACCCCCSEACALLLRSIGINQAQQQLAIAPTNRAGNDFVAKSRTTSLKSVCVCAPLGRTA